MTMAKFIIKATLTKTYEIPMNATDEVDALASVDGYIADDFKEYETGACWNFEAVKSTNS